MSSTRHWTASRKKGGSTGILQGSARQVACRSGACQGQTSVWISAVGEVGGAARRFRGVAAVSGSDVLLREATPVLARSVPGDGRVHQVERAGVRDAAAVARCRAPLHDAVREREGSAQVGSGRVRRAVAN